MVAAALLTFYVTARPTAIAGNVSLADLLGANDQILVFSGELHAYVTLGELVQGQMQNPSEPVNLDTPPQQQIYFPVEPVLDYSAAAVGASESGERAGLADVENSPPMPGSFPGKISIAQVPEPAVEALALLAGALAGVRRRKEQPR